MYAYIATGVYVYRNVPYSCGNRPQWHLDTLLSKDLCICGDTTLCMLPRCNLEPRDAVIG